MEQTTSPTRNRIKGRGFPGAAVLLDPEGKRTPKLADNEDGYERELNGDPNCDLGMLFA